MTCRSISHPCRRESTAHGNRRFTALAGWTWVLCGLASAIGWLALPIDFAETASIVLVVTALAATIVHLVRLAGRARTDPPTA